MSLFETLLAFLLAAIVLLQVSRRLGLPYPAVLAAAGVVVAYIPGVPAIPIDPAMALALFIAPAIVEASFDFPVGALRRFWLPLVALAVVAVLATAGAVAWVGVAFLGLPVAAALALGAIVAPPDAAAATAVLGSVSIPRTSDAVLRGESLFNDATALLLYAGALAVLAHGGVDRAVVVTTAIAVPGGIALGAIFAFVMTRVTRFVGDTLGANLLQFVATFLIWIVAEKLGVSAVLCLVTMSMIIARTAWRDASVRMRVHSNAVWRSAVFALNVLAFFLMGMQSRSIASRMAPDALRHALVFAAIVVAAVIATRLVVILAFNRSRYYWLRARGRATDAATLAQGFFVSWAGMRGLLTVATAFALPATFPQRDTVVLAAFAVVIATLVVQGATLAPVIRLLRLGDGPTLDEKVAEVRLELVDAAVATLATRTEAEADDLRRTYAMKRAAPSDAGARRHFEVRRALGLEAIGAQRVRLDVLHADYRIGCDEFDAIEESLDWLELSLLPDESRRIDEG